MSGDGKENKYHHHLCRSNVNVVSFDMGHSVRKWYGAACADCRDYSSTEKSQQSFQIIFCT